MGDRIRVKVTSVSEPRSGKSDKGEWTALDFKAKASTAGPEIKYGIFQKKELYPLVKPEAVLDMEVVDKASGQYSADGVEFINHNVMNFYVDEKPVIQNFGKGNGGFQREDPVLKRRSMAVAYGKDWGIAKNLTIEQTMAAVVRFDVYMETGK
jgi:hypothetical protein